MPDPRASFVRLALSGTHDPARREAWRRDQSEHPGEHRHTLAEVQRWFAENSVPTDYPSALLGGDQTDQAELFSPTPDNWWLEGWFAQLGWIHALGQAACLSLLGNSAVPHIRG